MSRSFNIYANHEAIEVQSLKTGNTPRAGRPASGVNGDAVKQAAPKRPSSAPKMRGVAGGRISKIKSAIAMAKSDEEEMYSRMQREDLLFALQEAKKKIRSMESTTSQLKAENQRWETEFAKQQKRIDKLVDTTAGNRAGQASLETRKDIEKTLVVRQLKQNIQSLRAVILEKDMEIESLKKNQKASKLLEWTAEREEYMSENLRLRKILKEIKEELQHEKNRREWGGKAPAGERMVSAAGSDLKKEVARLASGYQSILAGMSQAAADSSNIQQGRTLDSGGSSKRPKSARGGAGGHGGDAWTASDARTEDSAPKNVTNAALATGEPRRERLRVHGSGVEQIAANEADFVIEGEEDADVGEYSGNMVFRRRNEGAGGGGGGGGGREAGDRDRDGGSPRATLTASGRGISQLPVHAAGPAGPAALSRSGDGRDLTDTTSPFNLLQSGGGSLDGFVDEGPVRTAKPADQDKGRPPVTVSGAPAPAAYSPFASTASSRVAPVSPSRGVPPANTKYKVGDRVEGMFRGGTSWYNAVVKSIAPDGSYHLLYDDGDEERGKGEETVRKPGEESASAAEGVSRQAPVTAPTAAAAAAAPVIAPAPKAVTAPASESASATATATTAASGTKAASASASAAASAHKSDDGDTKSIGAGSTAASVVVFAVGDAVEALYDGGPSWFPACVQKANIDGTFHLRYDDGDEEERVPASMMKLIVAGSENALMAGGDSVGGEVVGGGRIIVGLKVEADFHGEGDWYSGTVSRDRGDGTFDILYDDGDTEDCVEESRIRLLLPAASAAVSNPPEVGAAVVGVGAAAAAGRAVNAVPTSSDHSASGGQGGQWGHDNASLDAETDAYMGTMVAAVGSGEVGVDLEADVEAGGGDRPAEGMMAPAAADAYGDMYGDSFGSGQLQRSIVQGSVPSFGDLGLGVGEGSVVEGVPAAADTGGSAVAAAASASTSNLPHSKAAVPVAAATERQVEAVSDSRRGSSSATAAESEKAAAAATRAAAAVGSSKFKVGDVVEGKFSQGDEWFPARVKEVRLASGAGGKTLYNLVYDDGDVESGVKEANIRFAPGQAVGRNTAGVAEAAAEVSSVSEPSVSKGLELASDSVRGSRNSLGGLQGKSTTTAEDVEYGDDWASEGGPTPTASRQKLSSGISAAAFETLEGISEDASNVPSGGGNASKSGKIKTSKAATSDFLSNYLDDLSDDEGSQIKMNFDPGDVVATANGAVADEEDEYAEDFD